MVSKEYFLTFELRRKIFHFLVGIFLVFLIVVDFDNLELILVALLVFAILLSVICKYKKPRYILYFLELFDKPKDLEKFPGKGAIYYLIGTLVSIILFERSTAAASVIILAVGDPLAHVFGRYYGKRKLIINEKKLLEGTLGGVFFATLAASFFVPWPVAFFGAAFGMIAEAIEIEYLNLDDNFFIPFVSGLIMQIIQSL